jgi:hypothetical protein
MRLTASLLVLIAGALCGCGTTMGWSKPDATPQEFARTRSQCHVQSIRSSYNMGGSLNGLLDAGRDERFRSCMDANGWTLVSRPSGSLQWW